MKAGYSKMFYFMVGLVAAVVAFTYLPVIFGISSTVKVVNLNVYSEKLREMLKQYPKKTIEIDKESDNGITFRVHTNDSHVQSVNVEKGGPTKGSSGDKDTNSKTPKPTIKKEKDFDEEKKVVPTDKPATPKPTPKKSNALPDCSDKGSKLGEFLDCSFIFWLS